MNIIKGKIVSTNDAKKYLDGIGSAINDTLKNRAVHCETVISAADKLSQKLSFESAYSVLSLLGVDEGSARMMVSEAKRYLSRNYIEEKIRRELGEHPFSYKESQGTVRFKISPLGVITHISAGNASGLPAFSVLEGLLAGNINILKLPGHDDGLSTALLKMLIDIEPLLSDYIYVFDLPSADADSIRKMLAVSDAAAVWGSDYAVSGIRSIAPPGLKLIEWGHRLSFACVTVKGETKEALYGIAKDICVSDQLLCSSPQCVYYQADSFDELITFGQRLYEAVEYLSKDYLEPPLSPGAQAEITSLLLLKSEEEYFGNKRVLRGNNFSVIIDGDPALCASPGYRNIWVKSMDNMFETLRVQKSRLQTAGLACAAEELPGLSELFYRCGVCRITECGKMNTNYAGEPHDGQFALRSYTKAVTCAL